MIMCIGAYIKSLSRRADTTVCVSIEVSNGSESEQAELLILDELAARLELEIGNIGDEELYELDRLADITAAYMSACSSLAYTQSSLKALYRKLIMKGFSKESSAEAVEIIRLHGFCDEQDIALRRSELMISKLWGRSRIIQKLREEGFPDNVISFVAESLEDVDFCENCLRVIEKKYGTVPDERREREKMYASLMRLGYSSGDIREAVHRMTENQ